MSGGDDHLRDRATLTTRAALASVASALFLLVLKTYAAWATASVAMLGSLADTGLDLIASLVTLFGVRVAAMPADREHRFGHGKAEAFASLVQAGLVFASAALVAREANSRWVAGAFSRPATSASTSACVVRTRPAGTIVAGGILRPFRTTALRPM